MTFDEDKLDEVVLALLHLNSFRDNSMIRAWKGFDRDSLNRLHDRDLIEDPKSKSRSVVLTQEGVQLAEELFRKHFGGPLYRSVNEPQGMPLPGPKQAFMLSKQFWPEFIEHQDCILRGDAFSQEHFDGFMTATKHDKRSVEHVVNHLHVVDMFPDHPLTLSQVLFVGRTLREMWEAKLARDFPQRVFLVTFQEPVDEDDVLEGEVTFYQVA